MNKNWTPYEDEILKNFVRQKKTAREAAEVLNRSRSSVISRAARIGMNFVGGATTQKPPTPKLEKKSMLGSAFGYIKRIFIPDKQPTLPFVEPVMASKNITIMDLNDSTCRWPVSGEGAQTLFCGLGPMKDRPYCETHSKIAYRT